MVAAIGPAGSRPRLLALAIASLAVLAAGACGDEPAPPWTSPIPFDTTQAWVHTQTDSIPLLVELADTDERRRFGMMTRPSLDPGSGMVFTYDGIQPGTAGYWMFNTLIPLDIAFIDTVGVIRRILTMEPCQSTTYPEACPQYPPGVEYGSALEVNGGWFAQHGVAEGARVTVRPR